MQVACSSNLRSSDAIRIRLSQLKWISVRMAVVVVMVVVAVVVAAAAAVVVVVVLVIVVDVLL